MAKRKTNFDGDDLAKSLEDNPEQWESVPEDEQNLLRSQLKTKERRISLRIAADVLEKLRIKAGKEGLPYQTYINSMLFKIAHQADAVEELKTRLQDLEKKVKRLKIG